MFVRTLHYIVLMLVRLLLGIFYRVEVRGLEQTKGLKGALVFPNHPSLVDPIILVSRLWRTLRPRPVAARKFYNTRFLHFLMRLIRTFPVDTTEEGATEWQRRKIEASFDDMKAALAAGDNIIIYPSGQLRADERESLGGKSGAYTLAQANPNAPLVLVRIRGLGGSVFSRYYHRKTPTLREALRTLWAHPHLLRPRASKIILDINVVRTRPVHTSARDFNRWLEAYYNAEPDVLRPDIPPRPAPRVREVTQGAYSEEKVARVLAEIAKLAGCEASDVRLGQELGRDLAIDSLAVSTLPLLIEEIFGCTVSETAVFATVEDVVRAAHGLTGEDEGNVTPQVVRGWERGARRAPAFPQGAQTLAEAYLHTAKAMGGGAVACGDDRAGVITYRAMTAKALLLARVIRKLPGQNIGMLLPASVAASVVSLAVALAGKTLVPLNWTSGRRAVDHLIRETEVEVIVSADAFLTRAPMDVSEETYAKIVTLESFRTRLGLRDLLRATLHTYRSVAWILEHYSGDVDTQDELVILGTSGSDGAPKGTPLTHLNVLSDIEGALDAIPPEGADEVLYSFLPPFHSFGYTMTMMLPLISGMRVVFDADPKKSKHLARGVPKWRVTRLAGTPSFLLALLKAVDQTGSLATVRTFLVGAERAPQELHTRAQALGIELLEGYGLTETSPLITVGRPGRKNTGVGLPLKGVQLCIVDSDTLEPVERGSQGLILVRGPNVFRGYLGNAPSPFVDVMGTRWLNTRDIGYLIPEGDLSITGRDTRFVKFGGEKVPLGAIEEALEQVWPRREEGPALAVMGYEREEDVPLMVLFTTDPDITLERANALLRSAGFPVFSFMRALVQLPEIPLLGIGKTNYKALPKPTGA